MVKEVRFIKKFVLWSTVDIYGFPKPELLPVKEDYEPHPHTLYGKSKYEQEKVIMEFYKNHNLPVITIRPAPVVITEAPRIEVKRPIPPTERSRPAVNTTKV